jgi:hypothetical protein
MKRTLGTLLAAMTLTACGLTPSLPITDTPQGTAPIDRPDPAAQHAAGWTLLGDAPSPRHEHTALFDAARDRMLVFGGDANDLWAQRLSGPEQGSWEHIVVDGEPPPPGPAVMTLDEAKDRLWVFSADALDRAWILPLDGSGGWTQATFGDAPKIALGFSLATDRVGRVLYAYTSGQPEMVALPLDGGTTWTRIAGPPQDSGFSCRDTLVHDAEHARLLVLSGGWPRGDVFALSLAGTPAWTKLNHDQAWFQYGASTVYDATAKRFLVTAPSGSGWLWSFSVNDVSPSWTKLVAAESSERGSRWETSAVDDPLRHRVLFFGGKDAELPQSLRNDTWALALGGLDGDASWSRVGTIDRRMPETWGGALAEVAGEGTILRFGGAASSGDSPTLRFDDASAEWTSLADDSDAPTGWSAGAWDPAGERLVTFGGYTGPDQDRTRAFDLASSSWALLDGPGLRPSARHRHSMVHDAAGQQMLLFGGANNSAYTEPPFGDLWSFSSITDTWTKLAPEGPAPLARQGHAAAFDPGGRRMLVHGGFGAGPSLGDTWMLELLPSPHWVALAPKGDAPPPTLSEHIAVHDPDSARFYVVGNVQAPGTSQHDQVGVWALSLEGEARWERYCPKGERPGRVDGALWSERGLFVTAGGSSWIFDPSAARCE